MKNLNLILLTILFSAVSISLLANEGQKPNILIEQPELPRESELIGISCTPFPRCINPQEYIAIQNQKPELQTEPATE